MLLQDSEIEVIAASTMQLDIDTTKSSMQDAGLPTMGFDTENFNPTGNLGSDRAEAEAQAPCQAQDTNSKHNTVMLI